MQVEAQGLGGTSMILPPVTLQSLTAPSEFGAAPVLSNLVGASELHFPPGPLSG